MHFDSRRSPVYSQHGMVASSQPLASQVGIEILRKGGNAVDAAVAVAAALNGNLYNPGFKRSILTFPYHLVTEPASTGIGGDMFCLVYDSSSQSVKGLNGSGRSPQNLTLKMLLDVVQDTTAKKIPHKSVHSVTVPGAAAGWVGIICFY